jgi:3-isopropylmalate/(R)-2-methylmalate dehydratase large subunit
MIEKILAKASGKKEVVPGDIVVANVDRMVLHDLSSNLVSKVFENEMSGGKIFDPDRIVFVFDHTFSPPSQADADVLTEGGASREIRVRNVFDSGPAAFHHASSKRLVGAGKRDHRLRSHTTAYGRWGFHGRWE